VRCCRPPLVQNYRIRWAYERWSELWKSAPVGRSPRADQHVERQHVPRLDTSLASLPLPADARGEPLTWSAGPCRMQGGGSARSKGPGIFEREPPGQQCLRRRERASAVGRVNRSTRRTVSMHSCRRRSKMSSGLQAAPCVHICLFSILTAHRCPAKHTPQQSKALECTRFASSATLRARKEKGTHATAPEDSLQGRVVSLQYKFFLYCGYIPEPCQQSNR